MLGGDTVVMVAGYMALFGGVGFMFIFVNLLVGRFLRPADPTPEKLEIYECGEPAIGSSFVQFDLRFYVVALVFIIFDVEVAFLFPWATVFGKSQALADPRVTVVAVETAEGAPRTLTPQVSQLLQELGVQREALQLKPDVAASEVTQQVRQAGRDLMKLSVLAVSFFFVVLFVGFAYEWRSGALDWVRAVAKPAPVVLGRETAPPGRSQESVLSV